MTTPSTNPYGYRYGKLYRFHTNLDNMDYLPIVNWERYTHKKTTSGKIDNGMVFVLLGWKARSGNPIDASHEEGYVQVLTPEGVVGWVCFYHDEITLYDGTA